MNWSAVVVLLPCADRDKKTPKHLAFLNWVAVCVSEFRGHLCNKFVSVKEFLVSDGHSERMFLKLCVGNSSSDKNMHKYHSHSKTPF